MRTFESPALAALAPPLLLGALLALLAATGPLAWWLVGAPLAEEMVFRAGVQARLRRHLLRHGPPVSAATLAIALTALAFGAAHAAIGAGHGWWTALPALAIGLVYERTRRVAPCVALHAAFNAVWLAAGPTLLP